MLINNEIINMELFVIHVISGTKIILNIYT